jgi:transcriptional regulator with XRE-family HTH domain
VSKTDARPPEPFGLLLQRLRRAAGLTQEGLARRAGVPVYSLRNWEYAHRQPRADALYRLAEALGVPLEQLIQAARAEAAEYESPALRALKRNWRRASAEDRRAFTNFITEETRATARRPKKA